MTKYEQLLKRINKSYRITLALRLYGYLAAVICTVVLGYLVFFFLKHSIVDTIGFFIILGVPFLLVNLIRRLVNAKRPYEIYSFYDSQPKKSKGKSFPSRHAFSVFSLGTVALFVNPLIGSITLFIGALMCVSRVLLGIHFIRDVVAGALIGVVSSLIGILILL